MSVKSFTQAIMTPTGPQDTPVVWGPDMQAIGPDTLTAGSDLDRTAVGPWPKLLASFSTFWNNFKPQTLKDLTRVKIPANYGELGSAVHWYNRQWEFGNYQDTPQGLIAAYPGSANDAHRPMFNILTPVVFGMQVLPESELQSQSNQNLIQLPAEFIPGGTASLGVQPPAII